MRSILRRRGMRAAQLTIGMTMLLAPASAFALSGTTSADLGPASAVPAAAVSTGPLPVRVAPRHVRLGQSVSVVGTTSAAQAGHRVVLQSASGAGGAWRQLEVTRIGRRGGFAFHRRLRYSRVLRAVEIDPATSDTPTQATSRVAGAAGAAGGAAVFARANVAAGGRLARQAAVRVAAQIRVGAQAHDILAGDSIHVAGHLLPARAGRRVALQARSHHRWRTLAHARTGRRGGFAIRYRPHSATGSHLRVVFGGDRANARTTGGAGAMTLYEPMVASWYDDAGTTACGFHAGLGVASRTLPCGTKVHFRHGGRTVTATVDDRGPYVGGREFDLNQSTAAALGFAGVGTVWASIG